MMLQGGGMAHLNNKPQPSADANIVVNGYGDRERGRAIYPAVLDVYPSNCHWRNLQIRGIFCKHTSIYGPAHVSL